MEPRGADDARSRFRRLFAYDAWANREALESVRVISDPSQRALGLLAHVIGAEWLWLARLTEAAPRLAVWPRLTFGERDAELTHLPAGWTAYLDLLDATRLQAPVGYMNSKGERWTSTVEDVLAHVPMHSSYHRGRIAFAVRAAGHEPPTPTSPMLFGSTSSSERAAICESTITSRAGGFGAGARVWCCQRRGGAAGTANHARRAPGNCRKPCRRRRNRRWGAGGGPSAAADTPPETRFPRARAVRGAAASPRRFTKVTKY